MTSSKAAPPLRIVYRSAEAENTKPRPTYYSKTLALVSLLWAAAALPVPPEIVFLNDGDIPRDRLALMEAHGTVRAIDGGSNRTTFRVAVARQAALATDTDDLVWFAEDDSSTRRTPSPPCWPRRRRSRMPITSPSTAPTRSTRRPRAGARPGAQSPEPCSIPRPARPAPPPGTAPTPPQARSRYAAASCARTQPSCA